MSASDEEEVSKYFFLSSVVDVPKCETQHDSRKSTSHPTIELANSTWQYIASIGQPLSAEPTKSELELQTLEDRVLYDASPLGAVVADINESIETLEEIDDQIEQLDSLDSFSEATPVMPKENDSLLIGEEAEPQYDQSRQLIVIDERVDDVEAFINDVFNNGQAGVDFDIVRLDPNTQGIETITEALRSQGNQKYDAVHIIAHGSDAELQLGATTLDADNLHEFQAELSSWTSGMALGADILLYGCDVAETDGRVKFLCDVTGDLQCKIPLPGNRVSAGY